MSQLQFYIPVKSFSDAVTTDGLAWVQAYPYDTWDHPFFGSTTIDRNIATAMKANFDSKVVGHEINTDYEHGLDPAKGSKASGWIKAMDVRDDGLYFGVQLTDQAKQEIQAGEWKYFSVEHWDEWEHPHSSNKFQYVVTGGALTNKPWVKGMKALPLNFSELVVERVDMKNHDDNDKAAGEPVGGEPIPIQHDNTDRKAHGVTGPDKDIPRPEPLAFPDDKKVLDTDDNGDDDETEDDEGKEETVVDIEAKLRELLNLPDGDVFEHIQGLVKEVEPLREAAKQHSQKVAFSQAYPEEYARLQRLEESDRSARAKTFAEAFLQFTDNEGKPLKRGFSRVAVDKIEDLHKKFSSGHATINDVTDVLNSVASTGIVDYRELGNSTEPATVGGPGGARQFAEKVAEKQTADGLSYADAVRFVAKSEPALYESYRETVSPAHNE